MPQMPSDSSLHGADELRHSGMYSTDSVYPGFSLKSPPHHDPQLHSSHAEQIG